MSEREDLQQEYDDLTEKLAKGEFLSDPKKLADASRRLKILQEKLTVIKLRERRAQRKKEAERVFAEEADEELRALAQEELDQIAKEELHESKEMEAKKEERQTAIMEIRAGAGGDEASLFAAELARMYLRFAERHKMSVTLVDETTNDLGGFKSLSFTVNGPGTYSLLQFEAGVHRVQRVPVTEKSGRLHTSTASVVVLPKIETKEFVIPAQDLRIDTMRASGPGGQFVNRRESAVRILHIPTGIMVTSQSARTQNANREQAMGVLLAKLADLHRQREEAKVGSTRKSQIGSGDRSEKIRTYNFPQDRVTDHRIGKNWHNLPAILNGDLDDIVKNLRVLRERENTA